MSATASSTVVVRDAGKRFDETWAVSGLDFTIAPGEVLGLIGPSGSGKTTAVRLLTGAMRPSEGSVEVFGLPADRLGPADRQRIGYLPQQPVLFDTLSAWENLQFHASLNGVRLRRSSVLRELLSFVELGDAAKRPVRHLSGGMQRRLALAAALVHQPDLVFLDEPTAGIDPILRARLWERFHDIAQQEGSTLVVTTQYIGEAAYCDRVGLLAEGRLIELDEPETLRRRAAGGDVVIVETDRPVNHVDVGALDALSLLSHPVELVEPTAVRLVVTEDEAPAVAEIENALGERGIAVVTTRSTPLDFDEMFVRLVEVHTTVDSAEAVS